jgi:hypothetical protein
LFFVFLEVVEVGDLEVNPDNFVGFALNSAFLWLNTFDFTVENRSNQVGHLNPNRCWQPFTTILCSLIVTSSTKLAM